MALLLAPPTPHQDLSAATTVVLQRVVLVALTAAAWFGWVDWALPTTDLGDVVVGLAWWQPAGCVATLLALGALAATWLAPAEVGGLMAVGFGAAYLHGTSPYAVDQAQVWVGTVALTVLMSILLTGVASLARRLRGRP